MAETPLEALRLMEIAVEEADLARHGNMIAALATLRRHLEPQPIESAPRDGGTVLVLHKGRWMCGRIWGKTTSTPVWISNPGEYTLQPTHWLPLPATANQE